MVNVFFPIQALIILFVYVGAYVLYVLVYVNCKYASMEINMRVA